MEKELLIFFLGALAVPGFTWWLVKKTMTKVEMEITKIKERQTELRETLPINYIRSKDYGEDIREIKSMLSRIFEKLESKVDK